MKMHSRDLQKGGFTVEAVFGMTVLVIMMFFIADLTQMISAKTQASRVSYSLATATKERSRFFDARHSLSQADFDLINDIAADLLRRQAPEKQDGYGLTVEGYTDGSPNVVSFSKDLDSGEECEPQTSIANLGDLRPEREDGVIFPIYQVTVCLKMEGFSQYFPGMRYVNSSSVLPGR
ncbi:tight adherence pilus pseudopilin TadF [Vibrio sp. B1Z05]|uniref:tight adherence pilus pseudopilin TadF n=1 Tax=Vibrio sp. B1Z05 TaxID=2654980 RepID=UPI0020A654A5|nr:tight adherence pilus pseudopilin TadF [Vibrio sp. B1Z05]